MNFKVVVFSMLFIVSSSIQAMESVIEMLPIAAMVAVPVVSGVTLYNSYQADKERDRLRYNFTDRGESEKANRFLNCFWNEKREITSFSCATVLAYGSLVYCGISYLVPHDKMVLGAAVITSVAGYALQKYNRSQLDHAKKLVAVQQDPYQMV